MKRPLAKKEKKRNQESDFVCDVVFSNKVPEVPYEPKFLKVPLDETRHIRYRETTLERDYKFELISGVDLGVTLDMIDYSSFTQLPSVTPTLEKVDEYLASGSMQTKQAHVLPFLHKFNYLSAEIAPQIMVKSETSQPQLGEVDTRDKLIKDIEDSFEICKTLPQHPQNPNLTVDAIFPIFPDEDLWGNEYTEMVFENDPWPEQESEDEVQRHTGAIVKSVSSSPAGKPLLAYFIPTESKQKKQNSDLEPQIEDEAPPEDQEFSKVREYTYTIPKGKATDLQPFFFIFRELNVSYHPIKTRVTMQKPTKEELAILEVQPVTSLVVKTLDNLSEAAKQQRDQQRKVLDDQSAQGGFY